MRRGPGRVTRGQRRLQVQESPGRPRTKGDEGRMRPGFREEDGDEDMAEVRQGLNLLGFNTDLVDWLCSSNLEVIGEPNEVRRMVSCMVKTRRRCSPM